jgi:hypothetical protein
MPVRMGAGGNCPISDAALAHTELDLRPAHRAELAIHDCDDGDLVDPEGLHRSRFSHLKLLALQLS